MFPTPHCRHCFLSHPLATDTFLNWLMGCSRKCHATRAALTCSTLELSDWTLNILLFILLVMDLLRQTVPVYGSLFITKSGLHEKNETLQQNQQVKWFYIIPLYLELHFSFKRIKITIILVIIKTTIIWNLTKYCPLCFLTSMINTVFFLSLQIYAYSSFYRSW